MNNTLETKNQKPIYAPKKNWLGISDWIVDKIGVRPATWKPILKVFKAIVAGSKYMESPIFGPIYKSLMSERFRQQFPNVKMLVGLTKNNPMRIASLGQVTPQMVREMERA